MGSRRAGALAPPPVERPRQPPRESAITDRVTLLADVAEIVARSHDLHETFSNVVDLVAKRRRGGAQRLSGTPGTS